MQVGKSEMEENERDGERRRERWIRREAEDKMQKDPEETESEEQKDIESRDGLRHGGRKRQ